jgi:hypothetical protein
MDHCGAEISNSFLYNTFIIFTPLGLETALFQKGCLAIESPEEGKSQSQSQSCLTTDGHSASLYWYQANIWELTNFSFPLTGIIFGYLLF